MTAPQSPSPWLSLEAAAQRIGVSTSYLKKKVAENAFPHRHVGRRVVCHLDEVDAWVQSKPGARMRGADLVVNA